MISSPEQATASRMTITREQRGALGGALLYLGFFTAMTIFNQNTPALPPIWWIVIAPVTTVAYLIILVYAIRMFCRLSFTTGQVTLLMLLTLLLFLVANPMVRFIAWQILSGEHLQDILSSLSVNSGPPVIQVLVPFLLILTGVFFGQLIARLIRERSLLVPVLLVSALIDFWGVYWGPVSMMSERAPAAVSSIGSAATAALTTPEYVRAALPAHLKVFENIAPPDNIGIGDFVFIALFLTCAFRFGLSPRRTMWGIFAGLFLASMLMAVNGSSLFGHEIEIEYLPGLVFICGGVLLANLREWKLTRHEWALTGVLVGILSTCISASIVHAQRSKPVQSTAQYRLSAKSEQELFTRVFSQISQETPAQRELILLDARFLFIQRKPGPQLSRCFLLFIQRPRKATPQNTDEVLLIGEQDQHKPDSWMITQESNRPPETACAMLAQSAKGTPSEQALLQNAHGIPQQASQVFDKLKKSMKGTDPTTPLIIQILPGRARLLTNGKEIKSLPLSPPQSTSRE